MTRLETFLLYFTLSLTLGVVMGISIIQGQERRSSGNCGPAAMGLTPEADVKPIKIDNDGHVLLHEEQK